MRKVQGPSPGWPLCAVVRVFPPAYSAFASSCAAQSHLAIYPVHPLVLSRSRRFAAAEHVGVDNRNVGFSRANCISRSRSSSSLCLD